PKEIRRFIIVGVCGGPEGPSSSVLVEAAGAMRQYYNILNWETASVQLDMVPLRDAKFSSVTFVPPLHEPGHSIAMARAGDLAKRAAAHGLRFGVTNINTQADLAAALRAGVHIHTGAYISGDVEQITPRVGIKPSQLPLKA
ncbi:MAG: hypothetical protein PVI23_04105, partial [Maricaulaceae bacterium]